MTLILISFITIVKSLVFGEMTVRFGFKLDIIRKEESNQN